MFHEVSYSLKGLETKKVSASIFLPQHEHVHAQIFTGLEPLNSSL